MSYKVIIFDWDGTLMNSEARIVNCVQQAARVNEMPVLPYEESKQIIGLSLDKAIETLYPEADKALVDKMAQAYQQHFLHDSDVVMQAYEGALDLLTNLKEAGYYLAVATGKSRMGLEAVLDESGFREFFDITRTPVESASKPSPLMLQQILQHFDLKENQAVMVGDTTFDMQMAQAINMDRAALLHGVHSAEQMRPFNPNVELENLQQLQKWILDRA